jgi:hypothetical protein
MCVCTSVYDAMKVADYTTHETDEKPHGDESVFRYMFVVKFSCCSETRNLSLHTYFNDWSRDV